MPKWYVPPICFSTVIALDTSPTRLALARHNAQIYGVADRIEFILSDYLSFAKSYLSLPSSSKPQSENSHQARKIDVVFLSPPWGGPSYLAGFDDDTSGSLTHSSSQIAPPTPPSPSSSSGHPTYSLSSILPIHGAQLFDLTRRITRNIAFYLPRNTRLDEVSALALSGENTQDQNGEAIATTAERIEIEEEWMGTKLKALTCYFGGLVTGQKWFWWWSVIVTLRVVTYVYTSMTIARPSTCKGPRYVRNFFKVYEPWFICLRVPPSRPISTSPPSPLLPKCQALNSQ